MVPCRKSLKIENLSKKDLCLAFMQVLIGSFFLAIISVFKVPLYPTPMTLQTLGVFLIPLVLGPNKGMLAVAVYLIEATCGWPILSGGGSNPLWILTPNFGFLLSFPLAAFIIGKITHSFSSNHFLKTLAAVVVGQLIICTAGVLGLSCFFGFEKAVAYGVSPFFLAMAVKILAATGCFHGLLNLKRRRNKGNC
jgi:biotin transport system substrate-specific component